MLVALHCGDTAECVGEVHISLVMLQAATIVGEIEWENTIYTIDRSFLHIEDSKDCRWGSWVVLEVTEVD